MTDLELIQLKNFGKNDRFGINSTEEFFVKITFGINSTEEF